MGTFPYENRNDEVLVKQESESSESFGCNPYERPIDEAIRYGIVNVDKPAGPTSHQVSSYVRKILKIDKAGHSGTLDPAVTGVLPVGLEGGTRITHSLLSAGKEYVCLMKLHDDIEESEAIKALEDLEGDIEQLPPVRSAVKRQLRNRKIYYIDILEIKGRDVLFRVGCEAGTYIRKLCHDLGEDLGIGAHMAELRRTRVGPFREDTLTTLNNLQDAFYLWKAEEDESALRSIILPVEEGILHLPKIWVLDTTVDSLCHGASLKVPGVARLTRDFGGGHDVAVLTLKGELVMIGKAVTSSKKILNKERGIAVKPNQVFMKPGTYPKLDR